MKYISILRGINVSGQKLIKMDALKQMYETLGFRDVQTYIQSGNVVFNSDKAVVKDIEREIHKRIVDDFGFDVPVIVLSVEDVQSVVKNNPFIAQEREEEYLHVTFLAEQVTCSDEVKNTILDKRQSNEELEIASNAIYLYCPAGYGKTKLTNNFLEAKMGVSATTRNWKTVNKLVDLANG